MRVRMEMEEQMRRHYSSGKLKSRCGDTTVGENRRVDAEMLQQYKNRSTVVSITEKYIENLYKIFNDFFRIFSFV